MSKWLHLHREMVPVLIRPKSIHPSTPNPIARGSMEAEGMALLQEDTGYGMIDGPDPI